MVGGRKWRDQPRRRGRTALQGPLETRWQPPAPPRCQPLTAKLRRCLNHCIVSHFGRLVSHFPLHSSPTPHCSLDPKMCASWGVSEALWHPFLIGMQAADSCERLAFAAAPAARPQGQSVPLPDCSLLIRSQ